MNCVLQVKLDGLTFHCAVDDKQTETDGDVMKVNERKELADKPCFTSSKNT